MSLTLGDYIYYILKPPVRLFLRHKFNIQVETNALQEAKGPYLLLGHHVTNYDPVISNAYSKRLIRYIAGDANQDSHIKKLLLAMMESIPFAKNRGDAKSIRDLVKHVKQGHPVGLYPEGGRNWDGTTDYIIPSTAKLVKLLKLPVYAAFFKGGYLSTPRWASQSRRGKMVLEISKILDRETVLSKSAKELHRVLKEKLDYNEFQWQRQSRVYFKGHNLAEYIQRLLYLCPNCQAVNSFQSQGDSFHCTNCNIEYSVNHYGEIEGCREFTDTVSWNRWQQSHLRDIIQKGFSFANSDVQLEKLDIETGKRKKEQVQLNLLPKWLELKSGQGAETVHYRDLSSMSITFSDMLEFYVGKSKYRITLDPRRHMSIKLLYDLVMKVKGERD